MVTITTGKFVSIDVGRGITHVVLVEPWNDTRDLLEMMEAESTDLTIITEKGEWEIKDVQVLSYDIIDDELVMFTLRSVFWS